MIRGGFLSAEDRRHLIALARDGSAASRLTRRANALVLLDDGWSCQEVATALLLNDDTPSGPREFHPEPLTDSVREPLDSYGSCHRAKAAAFR
jgi:hypothetical protein